MLFKISGAKLMMAVLAVAWLNTARMSAMKKALFSGPVEKHRHGRNA